MTDATLLDPALAARLRKIQQRISAGRSLLDAILARRDFGRELLAERKGERRLPNGVAPAIAATYGISQNEVGDRIRLAEWFTEEEVTDNVKDYGSWTQFRDSFRQARASSSVKTKKIDADAAAAKRKERKQLDEIRQRHEERLYEAMRNAPAGAINLPMTNRATKVFDALSELAALDPHVAASQMPAVRCREYSGRGDSVDWLHKFVEACDERRKLETPTLGHLRRRSTS